MKEPNQVVHVNEESSKDGDGSGVSISPDARPKRDKSAVQNEHVFPKNLILDIGGRKFKVAQQTLVSESGLFRKQLSGNYAWTPESDGSYFIDADPDLFEHLLRFMRRPEVFPLLYNHGTGFDYNHYLRLEKEAEYFQINALSEWIKDKTYLDAVKVKYTYFTSTEKDLMNPEIAASNEIIDYQVIPRTMRVHHLPCVTEDHIRYPNLCGHACQRIQADNEAKYSDLPYFQVVIVKKETIFNESVCIVNYQEDNGE